MTRTKVERVVSEITGRPEALRCTHWDGRVDVTVRPETMRYGVADIERYLPLNDLRRMIYEAHRAKGMTHEHVVAKIFRDGKVMA